MVLPMKIGHWQLACQTGDVGANLKRVLEGLERAADEGIAVLSYPECFLTGYFAAADQARAHSLALDGPEIGDFLARSAWYPGVVLVGFNERRGEHLRNTVLVARQGVALGTYSKAFPCFSYHEPGRDFPVFQHEGLCFGVVICADGGYIEPVRLLALKGARVIFAPHYNYIAAEGLINHFVRVRGDHVARARENGVWLLRGNSVTFGRDAGLGYDGVGYGDSYLLDPMGEIVVRSQRHTEQLIWAELPAEDRDADRSRSLASARALLPLLGQALADRSQE
jgi:predicted amidohydrolase